MREAAPGGTATQGLNSRKCCRVLTASGAQMA
jgi:hypothetical protein